ncbi:hypothetical protein Mpe_A0646 [Methylibium petroleiphilum PM1]|uniref:Uncharacterized protein n=1 Tax=Methylibium petroleiphilum (strain ATCC BAA-1232 / LMG 22953 / PM1) TaxID=420662 RepID=A2SDG9_METPP|nr:hypothetical protein Mpe_A0646 [Methylibium petroleiphilum PM1]
MRRVLVSRSGMRAGRSVPHIKKRHVKPVTRLPTKNVWQLLRWAFIVATSTGPETAPMLGFASLQRANNGIHAHVIHKPLWVSCGRSLACRLLFCAAHKGAKFGGILVNFKPNSNTKKWVCAHTHFLEDFKASANRRIDFSWRKTRLTTGATA